MRCALFGHSPGKVEAASFERPCGMDRQFFGSTDTVKYRAVCCRCGVLFDGEHEVTYESLRMLKHAGVLKDEETF